MNMVNTTYNSTEDMIIKLQELKGKKLKFYKNISSYHLETKNKNFQTQEDPFSDCESVYIENKHWAKINKAGLVGKNLLQRKNDYEDGGIFYGLFLATKIKYCLTVNKYGVIDEHKTFKGYTNVSDNLDRKEYFKMTDGKNLITKMPLSWKNSFSQGIIIPHKMRNCSDCQKDFLFENCHKLVNQKKNSLQISTN